MRRPPVYVKLQAVPGLTSKAMAERALKPVPWSLRALRRMGVRALTAYSGRLPTRNDHRGQTNPKTCRSSSGSTVPGNLKTSLSGAYHACKFGK